MNTMPFEHLNLPEDVKQLVLVEAQDWSTFHAQMRCYERNPAHAHVHSPTKNSWNAISEPFPVVLGENGSGWGLGMHKIPKDQNPKKSEGDKKSPAGIFQLKQTFGFHPSINSKMPYIPIGPTIEAIDDPSSKYYNQIINTKNISEKDWKTSEKMHEFSALYDLGIVVSHNENPAIPKHGSCIFIHIWHSPDKGTAGCTAMSPSNLKKLIEWINPFSNPLLIQLPNLTDKFKRVELKNDL